MQTVQFNAKFLGGEAGEASYPELTEPLRILTKKYSRFRWGNQEEEAFKEIKKRLCSNRVLVPYDMEKETRLYVDSSPVGTQATVCQQHDHEGTQHWRPVNHTSRAWTPPEAGYGQIERESNGILTGMHMNKMYTLGTNVEVITDHQPLISAYDDSPKPKQLRVDRHRTKLLPFQYSLSYEPGKETPCDYGSRHPPKAEFTEKEIEDWCIEVGDDIYVNRVIEDMLPCAITTNMIKREIEINDEMKLLRHCIITQNERRIKQDLKEYHGVFGELWTNDGIILKGNQIVVPPTLRAEVIGLAHEGHQNADKTLSLLRQNNWFPKMRKSVLDYVESCRPCLAAIPQVTPEPLQPNMLPERAWKDVHADFKGPIGGKYYFHVMIDQYSKYPEVDILKSTSFKKLRPCLDRIFSSQGIPETVTTDNGPPYPSHEMEMYAKEMGFQMNPTTPNDPAANGFAEIFVKILYKLLHTAVAEGKDPQVELYTYLSHYRATPHPTTGLSPSEMLNHRKLRTKLPYWHDQEENKSHREARQRHDKKKMEQKRNFDRRRRAKQKDIKVGDEILIKQQKSTTKPPFDPVPYTVDHVKGNRVTASRNGKVRVRDKNYIKKVKSRPDYVRPSWEQKSQKMTTPYEEHDIDCTWRKSKVQAADGVISVCDEVHAYEEYGEDAEIVRDEVHAYEEHGEQDATVRDEVHAYEEHGEQYETVRDEVHAYEEHGEQGERTDEEMDAHLQSLLQAAEKRVTRSSGRNLKWNSKMGDKDVLLED